MVECWFLHRGCTMGVLRNDGNSPKERKREVMEENPFKDLKITSADFLDSLSGRSVCPKCQKSRKYYCYTCYVPVQGIEDQVPKVKLPLQVDIIKHPSECDGKSTAAHAGVISPDYVTIYTYPCIPDYEDRNRQSKMERGTGLLFHWKLLFRWKYEQYAIVRGLLLAVLLVFPGADSTTLNDLAKDMKCSDMHLTKKVHNPNNATCHSAVEETCPDLSDNLPLQKNLTESDVDNSEKCGHVGSLDSEKDHGGKKRTLEDLDFEPKRDRCKKLHAERDSRQIGSHDMKASFDKVVFIDSTWNQTSAICSDERLKGLKRVELMSRKSRFWRHQKDIPDTYLSTIEAIYYFLRDYHELFITADYHGEYDNLLFFFRFIYQKIRNIYKGGKDLKAYQQRGEHKTK